MLSNVFLGLSLAGAEWVLYFLIFLSVISVALIFERWWFYRTATRGLTQFRANVRSATLGGDIAKATEIAKSRADGSKSPDLEAEMVYAVLSPAQSKSPEVLGELAHDAVMRAKVEWERNLSILATIGSNAPFVGLFGTVLGIIKAFHDLSHQAASGAQTVSSGISEALIATAVGILVAIPAVVAFNIFQRKVKASLTEAEALKSFLVGKRSS